ncbi:hypothetical protein HF086_010951 [Spodoptera exigua]|uniref:Uncharacterized protein n=1 Tax=Spodoptera exigua TaxID=7107 RepID=A0A922MHX9_SPOEX|nr:hypothetical protein HF086_010951 [Spodoptera exigua]
MEWVSTSLNLQIGLFGIAPLSPRWRTAIEHRVQDVRQLTMNAIGRGAHVQTGKFWNLSGTFLFTIYVMTALGNAERQFVPSRPNTNMSEETKTQDQRETSFFHREDYFSQ